MADDARPALAAKAKLKVDKKTGQSVLLYPEKGLLPNATGAKILGLCDGQRTVTQIIDSLVSEHPDAPEGRIRTEVITFLERLSSAGLLRTEPG